MTVRPLPSEIIAVELEEFEVFNFDETILSSGNLIELCDINFLTDSEPTDVHVRVLFQ